MTGRGCDLGSGGELELAPIASLRMSMSASAISVQRLYGGAKSVAPRFEIPELVERGTSGGEQHHIARPGGLRRMPHGGNEQFTVVDRHQRAQNFGKARPRLRSEEHTSELQSLMRNSYSVFCLKK